MALAVLLANRCDSMVRGRLSRDPLSVLKPGIFHDAQDPICLSSQRFRRSVATQRQQPVDEASSRAGDRQVAEVQA